MESDRFLSEFANRTGQTLEQARAALFPNKPPAPARRLARKPQEFDCSPLPLFGDAHKQKELF